jgi:hypothetical protein
VRALGAISYLAIGTMIGASGCMNIRVGLAAAMLAHAAIRYVRSPGAGRIDLRERRHPRVEAGT